MHSGPLGYCQQRRWISLCSLLNNGTNGSCRQKTLSLSFLGTDTKIWHLLQMFAIETQFGLPLWLCWKHVSMMSHYVCPINRQSSEIIGPGMQGMSPGAPPSALLWIYLLIAVIFLKSQTEPCCCSPLLLLWCNRYCRWGWRWEGARI